MKKIISLALCLLMVLTGVLALASCGTEQEKLKIVDVNLTDEKYAFVVKKGNTQLQSDFNAFLAKIKENGEFDKYVAKYFKTPEDVNAALRQVIELSKLVKGLEEAAAPQQEAQAPADEEVQTEDEAQADVPAEENQE